MTTNRAVLLLSVAAFASAASFRAADPLLPMLAAEFAVTAGGAAVVVTAFAIAYGLFQAFYGPLGDKYGKYATVCAMTLVSALGTLACAFAPTLEALTLARFAAGATVGALIPVSMAWIGDVIAYGERQRVLARFLLGQILGTAFGQSAGGLLGEHFGWRAIFLVLALLYVIAGVLLAVELRSNPVTRHVGDRSVTIKSGVLRMVQLCGRPWVRVVVAAGFIESLLMFGAISFIPSHLQQRYGVGAAAAGGMVAAFAAGGLMYALGARPFIARLGERGLALGGGLALGAGFLLLALAPAAWASVPCILLIGIGFYMLHSTLQVHATQMAPEARGSAMSLFALGLFTGQSIGVWLAGRSLDAFGAEPAFLVAAFGLAVLGQRFRRQLKLHARQNRPVS